MTSALAFGHDLNTLEGGEEELQQHIQRVFEMPGRRLTIPVPYWRYLRLPVDRQLDRSLRAIKRPSRVHRPGPGPNRREPRLREEPENFLEGMIADQEKDGTYRDQEIAGNVFTLLLAGEDTTAHTMAWTLWLIGRDPQIQARWAREADEVLGSERYPSEYDTIAELRYGEAVLRESMRLKPVAPYIVVEPLADTVIADTLIPAGTRLLLLTRQAGLQAVERGREVQPRPLAEPGPGARPEVVSRVRCRPQVLPGATSRSSRPRPRWR